MNSGDSWDDWLEQEEAAVVQMWSRVAIIASFLCGITIIICWML